jgi:hypothetical protein
VGLVRCPSESRSSELLELLENFTIDSGRFEGVCQANDDGIKENEITVKKITITRI